MTPTSSTKNEMYKFTKYSKFQVCFKSAASQVLLHKQTFHSSYILLPTSHSQLPDLLKLNKNGEDLERENKLRTHFQLSKTGKK